MKREQQTIYYDADCLMCRWYTGRMVAHGILGPQGRQCYQQAVDQTGVSERTTVDIDRARNEIALVDEESGEVQYGLASFFTLFGKRWPMWRPLLRQSWFAHLLRPLYKLISYNRKIISPPAVFEQPGSCTPDFHLGWRLSYILLATLLTGLVLTAYADLLAPLIGQAFLGRELLVCSGQLLVQATVLRVISSDRVWHYLGNMVTISFVGALGLLPILLLSVFFEPPMALLTGHFFFVVWLMFREHIRRVRYLGLPWYLTLTWVLYRLIILVPML